MARLTGGYGNEAESDSENRKHLFSKVFRTPERGSFRFVRVVFIWETELWSHLSTLP